MKIWYKIDPIQGAKDAITWNIGRYGIDIESYGNNQGIKARITINGIAAMEISKREYQFLYYTLPYIGDI